MIQSFDHRLNFRDSSSIVEKKHSLMVCIPRSLASAQPVRMCVCVSRSVGVHVDVHCSLDARLGPRVMRCREEITRNHKAPFSLKRALREHSLNAFLIRTTSGKTHTPTRTHTPLPCTGFCSLYDHSALLFWTRVSDRFTPLWVCCSSLLIAV